MARLTRRQIILGGVGTALLVPVSYGVRVTFGGYKIHEGLKILTSKEANILEAIGEVIIPSDNGIGVSVFDTGLVKKVDDLVSVMPKYNQTRVRLLFWSVEYVLPVRCFYFRKFTQLGIGEREKIILKLECSKIAASRALARALKSLVQAVYYNDLTVASKMGIDTKCLV